MADNPFFELPIKIENLLAALSKLYAQGGERLLQELVVNSQIVLDAGKSYDEWNDLHGHTLRLIAPESIFLATVSDRDSIQHKIADDINRLHNIQRERIDVVFIEMEVREDSDWRGESGLLISRARTVASDSAKRIWAEDHFRLFMSHKAQVKRETAELKTSLEIYGVSAFVAHEDIHPTRAWQDEIENALATMDGFVALMTPDFHESDWTDQEVGYALARGVPIVALRLGRDPYGFLGKFQGLSCDWADAPEEIVKLLMKQDRMVSAYIKALSRCWSFDMGNTLSSVLPYINSLSDRQIDEIIAAFNSNEQLKGSFGFNGTRPTLGWGPGVIHHLHRLGQRRYAMKAWNIEPV